MLVSYLLRLCRLSVLDTTDHMFGRLFVQEMMFSSEWKLMCGPPQQRHSLSVCKQLDAFTKPHIDCGHTLTSKFSIHDMSDQYFINGCFSRSGLKKKNRFSASEGFVFPCLCAPADLGSHSKSVVWPAG